MPHKSTLRADLYEATEKHTPSKKKKKKSKKGKKTSTGTAGGASVGGGT